MPERIYNEDEVAKLLKRAAELETERSVSKEHGFKNGLSLEELAQIASESGIDPELVQKAANELESPPNKDSVTGNKTKVNRDEIVCERWIDSIPSSMVMDDLVTELNHMYGTSDSDISWWDKLWDDYSGKAKVRKTASSLEWIYTDEIGYYTTRVLMQKRGSKFRIRVSKRQLWGFEWNTNGISNITVLPSLVVLTVIGSVISNSALGTVWPGLLAAVGLTMVTFPLIKVLSRRFVDKHKNEVIETADALTEHALQLVAEDKKRRPGSSTKSKPIDLIEIEIKEEDESDYSPSLKNNLREE
jgi:hypothetical protein